MLQSLITRQMSDSREDRFRLPQTRPFTSKLVSGEDVAEFPIDRVRAEFPALEDDFIFFDNAAGAQSPQTVLNAVADHLLHRNVQRGGRYRHSQEVDEAIAQARASVALLVNAR